MREIKFRARTRGHNGPVRWVYWSVFKDCMCDIVVGHDMDKETLCEWTGLLDWKTGEKIWEGNVVEYLLAITNTEYRGAEKTGDTVRGVVEYSDYEASFGIKVKNSCTSFPFLFFNGMNKFEIIGNIYDHSHLLE